MAGPYTTITDCRFDIGLIRDGIRFDANATRCQIGLPGHGNRFVNIPGICINLNAGITQPQIYDNIMGLPANTAGDAITFAAGVLDATVDGNKANFGDTTMGNVPFTDAAAAGANNWLLNYQGITAVMPA